MTNKFMPNMILLDSNHNVGHSGESQINHIGDTSGHYTDKNGTDWEWDDGTFYDGKPGWYDNEGRYYGENPGLDWEWFNG